MSESLNESMFSAEGNAVVMDSEATIDCNEAEIAKAMITLNVIYMDFTMLWVRDPCGFIPRNDEGPLPVVRIFGNTPAGQRAMVHIHGFLPYLYFRPKSPDDTSFDDIESVRERLPTFQGLLEHHLLATRQGMFSSGGGFGNFSKEPVRLVHELSVERNRNIYGYHETQTFVKVRD